MQIIQGPTKGLTYSELGKSWLRLWHLSPSSPLKWHDAFLSPVSGWPLGVVVFRPLWQELTAVVLCLVWQGSNPELKTMENETQRLHSLKSFLQYSLAMFSVLLNRVNVVHGGKWSIEVQDEMIRMLFTLTYI